MEIAPHPPESTANKYRALQRSLLDSLTTTVAADKAATAPSPSAESTTKQCRVCYDADKDDCNPLLTPCRCRGSVGHIHSRCLQEVIMSSSGRRVCAVCGTNFNVRWRLKPLGQWRWIPRESLVCRAPNWTIVAGICTLALLALLDLVAIFVAYHFEYRLLWIGLSLTVFPLVIFPLMQLLATYVKRVMACLENHFLAIGSQTDNSTTSDSGEFQSASFRA